MANYVLAQKTSADFSASIVAQASFLAAESHEFAAPAARSELGSCQNRDLAE
jgi:hypothetical protein